LNSGIYSGEHAGWEPRHHIKKSSRSRRTGTIPPNL
jgi:hypothetical protein